MISLEGRHVFSRQWKGMDNILLFQLTFSKITMIYGTHVFTTVEGYHYFKPQKKYHLSILFDTLELQIVTCSENVVSLKVWLYFTRTPVHRRGKYERNCNDKRASERSPWQSEECVDLPGRIAVGQEPCLNKLWKTAKHTSVTTSSNYCFLLARKWHPLRRIFFKILQGKNVVIGTRT